MSSGHSFALLPRKKQANRPQIALAFSYNAGVYTPGQVSKHYLCAGLDLLYYCTSALGVNEVDQLPWLVGPSGIGPIRAKWASSRPNVIRNR